MDCRHWIIVYWFNVFFGQVNTKNGALTLNEVIFMKFHINLLEKRPYVWGLDSVPFVWVRSSPNRPLLRRQYRKMSPFLARVREFWAGMFLGMKRTQPILLHISLILLNPFGVYSDKNIIDVSYLCWKSKSTITVIISTLPIRGGLKHKTAVTFQVTPLP